MFEVNIYLETSLKGPVTKDGWHAAVLEFVKKDGNITTREDFERETSTTYHRQCLRALIKALTRLNASCIVHIYSDSVYVENGIMKNLQEWKEIASLTSAQKVIFHREKRNAYSAWMQQEAKTYGFGVFESTNKAVRDSVNTEYERNFE